jgi:hypothetical protein
MGANVGMSAIWSVATGWPKERGGARLGVASCAESLANSANRGLVQALPRASPKVSSQWCWSRQARQMRYLMACGLIGEPTALLMFSGGATNMNS